MGYVLIRSKTSYYP